MYLHTTTVHGRDDGPQSIPIRPIMFPTEPQSLYSYCSPSLCLQNYLFGRRWGRGWRIKLKCDIALWYYLVILSIYSVLVKYTMWNIQCWLKMGHFEFILKLPLFLVNCLFVDIERSLVAVVTVKYNTVVLTSLTIIHLPLSGSTECTLHCLLYSIQSRHTVKRHRNSC